MVTYSTAKVGTEGIEFFFADSGTVVGSDDYTTLAMYHGSAFNSHTFHKLLPLAAERNLRVVLVNRRQYRGSSTYTDEEINNLQAGRKVFWERIGLHVTEFLIDFAHKNKVSKDRKCGGFAVLGWSIGVTTALALLAHPDAIPKEYYVQLEPYLRIIVMYDPPYFAFGYDLVGDIDPYDPWTDPNIQTHEERYRMFQRWVSGYYDHPNIASDLLSGLDYRQFIEQASIDNMTPEDMSVMYEEATAIRSELAMTILPAQATVNEQANRALFDRELAKAVLPDVQVVHIVCIRSHWHCLWGYISTKKEYECYVAKGSEVRGINFVLIPEGNHFVSSPSLQG